MVNEKHPKSKRVMVIAAAIVVGLGGSIAGLAYWAVANKTVYIDKAQIQAPLATLTASTPSILRAVYVREGDVIQPNAVVAQAGVELIKSTSGGLVVSANNNIGKQVTPQDVIVSLVDPSQLRVLGQVAENKGYTLVHVGQTVEFTVDAFGSKKYLGLVDEVSPTSHASGVVFNISDQRETQTFDIKVRYDTHTLPELKNGMSARLWIYTK